MKNIRNTPILAVGDKRIMLKPTVGCMADIEDKTDKTINSFSALIATRALGVSDTIAIISIGSKAADNEMSSADIEKLISDYGLLIVQEALADFLNVAMFGGTTFVEESKKKAIAEKKSKKAKSMTGC